MQVNELTAGSVALTLTIRELTDLIDVCDAYAETQRFLRGCPDRPERLAETLRTVRAEMFRAGII